ncbi:MAG: uracil-DNA glycosylase [Sphingomonas sp.]|uniref:uracil-DNA glycosylase family protein n=1 Tax=Sphingomonas sp. TaxID=28214 RepID=UPI001AD3E265|nr:uracil-DNA glycosylase family protein [Sphingomonas sp.]MBN8807493.1 uracil-DNA glycosylase [Sphingomonas sp.]
MGADQNHDWRASIASALEWWRDAGVDCELDEVPRDWLARAPIAAPVTPAIAAAAVPALPDTLDAFVAWRIGEAAPEGRWPGRPMAPQGSAASGLMVVVDMPDREDEAAGALLSGAAGRLFDRMLAAIGRDRQSIHLASVAVKRPPAGRLADDVAQDLAALLRHHLALARPKRILALGNAASRAIAGLDVASARGNLHAVNHDGGTSDVVASFHPRFLLERPAAKADAWKDLRLLIGGFE